MALERLAMQMMPNDQTYPFKIINGAPLIIDWQPTIAQLLADLDKQAPAQIAARFHHTLADIMLAITQRAGQNRIILSGGCMQNAYLVTHAAQRLEKAGFAVYCHQNIPPNDGGLAAGQIYAAKFLSM
jgi:hydrogenase maturation protein HypF